MRRSLVPVGIVLAAALGFAVRGQEQPAAAPAPAPVAGAIATASPSVVSVELVSGEPLKDAPRRRLFRAVGKRSSASGFVIGKRQIVTHAVLGLFSEAIYAVTTVRGTRYEARLVRLDREREVAVLETQTDLDAPAIRTAPSGTLRPGALVVALGDPFGVARDAQATAALGVLEARTPLDALEISYRGDALVTDAAINPGSEGGPLIDLQGRAVGVLAPLARDRRLVNPAAGPLSETLVGYAIPIEEALQVVRPRSPRAQVKLGFQGRASDVGIQVVRVTPGSAAHRAGLRAGDVVRTVNDTPVRSGNDLRRVVEARTDDALRLSVERSGRQRDVVVNVGKGGS